MVNTVRGIALEAMRVNQIMSAQLTRIRYGFLMEKNIQEAKQTVLELQNMLQNMEQSVHKQPPPPSRNFIPLK
jgi:hypothetical protein